MSLFLLVKLVTKRHKNKRFVRLKTSRTKYSYTKDIVNDFDNKLLQSKEAEIAKKHPKSLETSD